MNTTRTTPTAVWMLLHRRGCGRPAFLIEEHTIVGARRPTAWAVLLDGSRPAPNDRMICCSCGKPIGPRDLAFDSLVRRDSH